jgi:hypothetical protein
MWAPANLHNEAELILSCVAPDQRAVEARRMAGSRTCLRQRKGRDATRTLQEDGLTGGQLAVLEQGVPCRHASTGKLKELKRQVESAIQASVAERRHEIESELLKLSRFDGRGRAKVVRAGARGMVARKIGEKLDDSIIANGPKASKPKQRTKTRKTRVARQSG